MLTRKNISFAANCLIVFFLLFGFRYIPPFGSLSPLSMQVIGVFAGVLYGWIRLSIGWPSLLGIVALGQTEFFSMNQLLVSAFGSQVFMMFLGLLLLSAFVQQAELTDMILDSLMNLKSARGRPFAILFYFLLAGFFASLLSHCIAVLIIFLELFRGMMKQTGIKPYSSAVPCFLVGMVYSFCLGDIALPFKSTSIVGIGAYEAAMGVPMDLVSYTLFALPFSIFLIMTYVLLVKYIFRCDLDCLRDFVPEARTGETIPLRKKVSLIAVILALLALLLPNILPASWQLTAFVKSLGLGGLTLLIVAILLIVRVDGEPLMDLQKVAKNFSWNVLFLLAFLLPVAGAISSDKVGLKPILINFSTQLLQGMPDVMMITTIILLAAIITNFANNLVVAGVFITMICMMGNVVHVNPELVSILILFASCLAIFFPAACPMNAIVFSQKDIVTFRQQTSLALKVFVAEFSLIAIVGLGVGRLFFK